MKLLESYALGSWYAAPDEGEVLRHAATAEPIARLSATGLDYGAVLEHGRRIGGPALRKMTFHQRSFALKALAGHLGQFKDELNELSHATGATRRDCTFDVDGGIITTRVLSSKSRQELPNATVLRDGGPEQLSRRGTFVGQHILTPLHGVVLQINAFNFPVWGMLEKLAPAVIAGIPTVVKPAPQTAYVTEQAVRRIVESGILPEGALQFVCGDPGDLLDHLTSQDVLAFTGSAATAEKLHAHPNVLGSGVRFNAERDSLNAAILGPDAEPGTPEFDLYVAEVVSEITAKAGQRCTAIRRALVPRHLADAVVEALRGKLAEVRIGHPADPETEMGCLVSLEQREAVRRCLDQLTEVAERVIGDPSSFEVHGADAEEGAFLPPTVLYADDPTGAALHEVEAFGPVCAVLPYEGLNEAIDLAHRGRGSLVASLFTHVPDTAREVTLGIAADHGRVHLVDRDCAKEQTGHGSPLPAMVHGGPGRAGGGEELGGMRAVRHLMQRTAVQGPPTLVSAVTGRWMPGAATREPDVHPMALHLEDVQPGDTFTSEPREISVEDIEHFADFTGDRFYAHLQPEAMDDHPFFEGRVAHGYLILSFAAGLFVYPDPGPLLANQGLTALKFAAPVYPGEAIAVTLTCASVSPREDEPYGEVRWHTEVTKPDGAVAATYELLTVVAKRGPRPS